MNTTRSLLLLALATSPILAQSPAVLLRDIRPGSTGSGTTGFAELQGRLYFTAQTGALSTSFDLFVTDGTPAGTLPLGVSNLAQVHNGVPVAVGATLFFLAWTAAAGQELWVSDGTLAGTRMLADLNPGNTNAFAEQMTSWRGYCWFFASVPLTGNKGLWRSDGTAAGTVPVSPTWSTTRQLTATASKLFFTAFDPTLGEELWVLDDPSGTPRIVHDINPGLFSAAIDNVVEWRGKVFFSADDGSNGHELWSSDGTAANTVLVADVNPGPGSARPTLMTPTRDYLFFQNAELSMRGPIWQTDGTQAGTQIVPFTPVLYSPGPLVALGNVVYARANPSGSPDVDLWRMDGTPSGIQRVRGANQSRALSPQRLCAVGSRYVYFMGDDGATGNELWRSDGTTLGTTLVADVSPGISSSMPSTLRALGGQLVFCATTAATGVEPFAVPLDAHGQAIGSACGAAARATTLAASDPVLGQPCALSGRGAYAGSTGFLFVGLPSAGPLPLPFGGPSCRLLLAPALLVQLGSVAVSGSTWSLSLPIPSDSGLFGVLLRMQGIFAPTDGVGGLDVTNAVNLNLGK